ncbi:MAG: tetratricopeptide repeat protein [Vicinamibacterales bacterium]
MSGIPLSDWDDVGDLVEHALDLPAADRDAHLQAACADDAARLARARRVLAAADAARSFLARPAADVAADLAVDAGLDAGDADDDPARPGDPAEAGSLGAYRLLRRIGRGGMGEVYLAERADDEFRRQVAIKIVRPGLGDDLIARFRHERQLLASLQHPHIAQLFDGGVTDDGRPYLVMEYVDGRPLDRHADDGGLSVDARLGLFLQICDAVESAHRRLVVHRDLKPGNVLVTRDGVTKLLDFGVAKLLEPDPGADTPETRAGFRVMTPEYASPEQFLGEPSSTATDVYALGAVLYELLTGVRAHEAPHGSLKDLEQLVLEREPDPPSTACRRTSPAGPPDDRARTRGTTVDGLARQLRGDLDNIVLTAMRREPDRRYPSVAALRADLERHREGLPVSARPATVGYRAAKFVRRHRAAVAAAVLVGAAIVIGTTTTLVQARAAAREGRRAEQIRDFLVGVFEISNPDASRGETVTARELLDRGSERVDRELAGEPEVHADMLGVLGRLYQQLGMFAEARMHFEHALTLQRQTPADPLAVVDTLTSLGAAASEQDDLDQAEAYIREALAIATREEGPEGSAVAAATSDLAGVFRKRGDYEEAERLNREAVAIRRHLGDPAGLASALNGLAVLLTDSGHAPEAVTTLEEALALARPAGADTPTTMALMQCNLANALEEAGRPQDAIPAFETCIDQRRRLLGDRHPDLAVSLNSMGLVYSALNQYDDAERVYREALDIQRGAFGEQHTAVAATLNNLAVVAYQRGRYDEAAATFRELVDVWRAILGPDHPNTLNTTNNLGMSLRSAGDLAGAEQVLTDVLNARERTLGHDNPQVGDSLLNLAGVLRREGKLPRALELTREAIPILEQAFPDGHPSLGNGYMTMGRIQLDAGRPAPALEAFDRALALRTAIFGAEQLQSAEARVYRGRALAALGRTAEARTEIETAIAHITAAGLTGGETYKLAQEALAALGR